jgi:ankyrin repeat protein
MDIFREDRQPTLHQAAKDGNRQLCENLLDNGMDINSVDADRCTAFFYAAQCEQREVFELLLNRGADVNIMDNQTGLTPLHCLAEIGNVNLMRLMIQNRRCTVDICIMDNGEEGRTPVHLASQNGHVEVVNLLLTSTNQRPVNSVSGSGKTPLMYAAQYNQLPVIRVLAEHSADVNYKSRNEEGLTPLHYAVMNGNKEIVTELLNMGANVSIRCSSTGTTPLHVATMNGNLEILKLLHEKGCNLNQAVGDETGNLPIHLAVIYGHKIIVQWLYETGRVPTFVWNKEGDGPLHLAAKHNNANMLSYILNVVRLPIDMRTINEHQHTALHIASIFGNYSVINYLIFRKADVNKASGNNSFRPLHYATMNNIPQCIQLLYQAGGNVHIHYGNEEDTAGGEPLLITAAKHNSCNAAAILLSENICVYHGYRNKNGLTALHHAAMISDKYLINLLLSKGANVNDQDVSWRTPVHYAVERGDTSILQEILWFSPSLAIKDIRGMNAVPMASNVTHRHSVLLC